MSLFFSLQQLWTYVQMPMVVFTAISVAMVFGLNVYSKIFAKIEEKSINHASVLNELI